MKSSSLSRRRPRGHPPSSSNQRRRPRWPRWRWVIAALFAAAAIWRLVYLTRLAGSPLWGSLRDDARIYWVWAEHLANVGPLGTHPFFLGPLYPYVLYGLRVLGVASIHGVLIVQALWGAAAVALLADATRRLTGPGVGLVVGLLMAGYESAVFFDGLILSESLLFFLECLLLWWVIRSDGSAAGWRVGLPLGSLIGLCAEGRATSALLLVPGALLLRAGSSGSPRRAWIGLGSLVAAFLVVAAPAAIRNHAVSREWIPFTYNFGLNLYVGNNPKAGESFVPVVSDRRADPGGGLTRDGGGDLDGRDDVLRSEGIALSPSGSSRHWAGQAWSHIRTHPGETLAQGLRKLGMLWNRKEYPQIENIDEFRAIVGPLGWPWLGSFALIGPLALAGAWFARRRWAPTAFVTDYVLVMTLTIVPFFVTDRYRHHLIPGAAVLAGVALAHLRTVVSSHDRGGRWAAAAAVACGLLVVHLPAPTMDATRYQMLLQADLGARWLEHGRPDRAAEAYEEALRAPGTGPRAGGAAGLSPEEQAELYANYGRVLIQLGRTTEASAWLERARARSPEPWILRTLAGAYAASGQSARADSIQELLSRLEGGPAYLSVARGWAAARAANFDEAERWFERAVEEGEDAVAAWGALIRVRAQRGHIREARATLERARGAGLPRTSLRVYQALLAALEGDAPAAQRALADVPEGALTSDPTLAEVVRVTREVLARRR
jgi:Tfp pilus assembly protein PilF